MKNILIVFVGGTFSMKIEKTTKTAVPYFHSGEILKKIPEAWPLANLTHYEFGNYPGPHITPELMLKLSEKVKEFLKDSSVDGIIITHGTDTLEETAYFLDLTIKTKKPIVVIGSMKTSSEPDWDGPRNLIDAIHICNNSNSEDIGVLVCLNGEINAASEVTKTHTEDIETFHSLDFGALGFIDRGKVFYNRMPRKLETIETKKIVTNVDLIKVYAGMNEKFFKLSADSGTEGLVIEAMGVGNVPPSAFEGIKYVIEKNIPVVLVSRCPAGETLDSYGYPGAGKWLKKMGVIFTDYQNGQKARIKLILALGMTKDQAELQKIFNG
jgi:L-asparaginase